MANSSILAPSLRVLSVQSHVVSGYCGNKSATFPLQLLEFEVDVINTVQLSNHTQYAVTKGQIFNSKDLEDLHTGLKANKLLSLYDHVLSGYVADVSYIISMAALIKDIKLERKNKHLDCWYTFDPVLGDDGIGYYVPGAEKVADAYKKYLLPLADIITPNRFEASILSGVPIDPSSDQALDQSLEAVGYLHRMGIKVVVLTSLAIADDPKTLMCIVSHEPSATSNDDSSIPKCPNRETWVVKIPRLDCPFTGTGDLFTALFTGWLHKTNFNLKKSLENTANTIHEILEDTLDYYHYVNDGSVQSHELRLVQNKKSILSPGNRIQAEAIRN